MHRLAAYLKEREGFDSIITDEGFAAYRIEGENCRIYDIFIEPDYRKKHVASEMVVDIEGIAKRAGCKYLCGSVITGSAQATESLKFILAYGLIIFSSDTSTITLRKDL